VTIAVFAAHPDDEVLGCGATIARLSGSEDIHFVILGEGVTSRLGSERDLKAVGELHDDARRAAKIVGAASVRFDDLPDNRFDSVPLLEVVRRVEAHIEELRPASVYTHHPGDLNVDHLVTFRAVLTATRPMRGCAVRDLYAFEVSSSTEWALQAFQPVFRPNVFADVSETIERKVEAMESYRSERRPFPHPRSPEALRATARRWGSVAGADYAEAFELIRSIR
jgi:LmbE family N-acetylglucosaminyl deacetylase